MKKVFYLFLSCLMGFACSETGKEKVLSTSDASGWKTTNDVKFGDAEMTLEGTATSVWTKDRLKNFELSLECKTARGAEGGVIFHTNSDNPIAQGYEVFINNNNPGEGMKEWYKTGSLTAIRNFAKNTALNETWFPVRIEVAGKQIRVFVNDVFVTDYTEPEKPYREGAFTKRLLSQGLFALVNHSDAPVSFRNIRVKSLPNDTINSSEAIAEASDPIIRLHQQGFPVIDYHLHLKGGWTKEEAAAQSRKYGITYGIAPNCGKNFPITDDSGIDHWLDTMKHQPFLMPMQAEGREWVEMFSKNAIEKFDYRFTDAMTWTDHKGRRMRLWIPEETFVDDKQQFMDMLVDRACGILSNEPVDIYVNPTFIPEQLQPEYDQLWTKERMQKIIDACVKSGIAIEINNRYRIPSPAFIRLAKENHAKFTFGTNNTSAEDVGKLEYSIEMIRECGLTPSDMFIPVSKNM